MGGNLDPRAAAFLAKQSELVDLQIADLKREDKLRHWSLRVRHISDVLKVAFEVSFAFIAVLAAVGLGATVWSALHDNDLVIEPFSVPPDFAARGLTGEVLAADINDKVTALSTSAQVFAFTGAYRPDENNDVKIQIPDTGISVGQLYRYLVGWLGHERHISGSVYRSQTGLVLSLRLDGSPTQIFEGPEKDFARTENDAVEKLMSLTQPVQYGFLLMQRGRIGDAISLLTPLITSGAVRDRVAASVALATALQFDGDLRPVLAMERQAIAIDPEHAAGLQLIYGTEADLGQDETALRDALAASRVSLSEGSPFVASARQWWTSQALDWAAEEQGDYQAASAAALQGLPTATVQATSIWPPLLATDLAYAHDVRGSTKALKGAGPRDDASLAASTLGVYATVPLMPHLIQSMDVEDWKSALADMEATYGTAKKPGSVVAGYMRTFFDPWFAFTLLKAGRLDDARRLIVLTPTDCYFCLRVRAAIDAGGGRPGGAEYWFVHAAASAPSLPFAYKEWGEMLLRRGDYAGAIAKFEEAHQRGPHYADPLEMWGEALMQENRSDLALAKFAEADKYAPNWGRLHLKWGEALSYASRKGEARMQFELARGLDLSEGDRSRLARGAK
jgi:tetratricopeptide (TPR) repeat protein